MSDVSALQRSDLNEFLFADVGTEPSGMMLSVVSLFARQGNDPWREAGRLADLPKAAAADSLAHDIAEMPQGRWNLTGLGGDRRTPDRPVAGAPGQDRTAVADAPSRLGAVNQECNRTRVCRAGDRLRRLGDNASAARKIRWRRCWLIHGILAGRRVLDRLAPNWRYRVSGRRAPPACAPPRLNTAWHRFVPSSP